MDLITYVETIIGISFSTASAEIQWILAGTAAIIAISFNVLLMWGLFLFVKGLAHGK